MDSGETTESSETVAIVPVREQTVDFYGDRLPAAQADDETIYVPLRPICEALGLDWPSQTRRVRRDPVLVAALQWVVIMTTHRGEQRFLALPLKLLPGFLFGLTVSKVRPELQAKILRYQLDCYEVLWNAFKGDILPTAPPSGDVSGARFALEIAEAVAALARQQLAFEDRVTLRLDALASTTDRRLSALEMRLDPKQVLTEEQAAELALAVKNVGKALERQGDRQGYAKVYSELYRRYRISSYKNLPQNRYQEVLTWLAGWAGELE